MLAPESPEMPPVVPYGHMVHEYYVRQVGVLAEKRKKHRASIHTRDEATKLVQSVRSRIFRCFGKFPARTPLNPRITGMINHGSYRIEKVIFESRPHFPVTANLYVPREHKPRQRFPAVLGTCGHALDGKAAVNYQSFCHALALLGFVVLIYDPIGQGERQQYVREKHPLAPAAICDEHNMLGNRMQLLGDWFGTWCAWDGIRALDYLLSRPEVDTGRVGLTGNSGGGTLACYLNVLDARINMVAPSCFVTTYQRNISNELPQDSEQNPPGFLAAGLEMADFIIARAPRPTLLLGQHLDFFDVRGLQEAFDEIGHIYRLLGAEDQLRLFIGPDAHGYFQKNRVAMYQFFARQAGLPEARREPRFSLHEPATLACTKNGSVVKSLPTAVPLFRQTAEAGASMRRPVLSAAKLASSARAALKVEKPKGVPEFRVLRPIFEDGRDHPLGLSRFAVITEEPSQAILYFLPAETQGPRLALGGSKTALLYLPHLSSRADIDHGELNRFSVKEDRFSLDVRGSGESIALTCHHENIFSPYDADFLYASVGNLIARPYLGRKVFDVLQTLSLLKQHGYQHIHLAARGLGSLVAAFAALLSPSVKKLTLKNTLLSYTELVRKPATKWPLSHFLPGVLREFDLPDVYRALSSRDLVIVRPWDETMEPWSPAAGRRHAAKLGLRNIRFGTKA